MKLEVHENLNNYEMSQEENQEEGSFPTKQNFQKYSRMNTQGIRGSFLIRQRKLVQPF